jgi:tRNA threonylcarbamoyladenosine biosynthesis protein TsaE
MKQWIAASLADLPQIAQEFLGELSEDKIVCFDAPMGAGKTTFITSVLKEMGIEHIEGSPTYSIVNTYEVEDYGEVFHFDLYRLKTINEALDIGIEELLDANAYCFIEWSEKIHPLLPDSFYTFSIEVKDKKRIFTLSHNLNS